MKRTLFVLVLLLIFSINVIAIDIDIGSPAINRGTAFNYGATFINMVNPANTSGKITSVEIYAPTGYPMTGCKVATFFLVPETEKDYSTRDWVLIGDVPAGSKQTFEVDLTVQEDDYIGIYWESGRLENDETGGGYRSKTGAYIPCTNATFGTQYNNHLSLYGTGITEEEEEANAIFFGTAF